MAIMTCAPTSDSRCISCCHWRLRRLFRCAGIGLELRSLSAYRPAFRLPPCASTAGVVVPIVSNPDSSVSLSSSTLVSHSFESYAPAAKHAWCIACETEAVQSGSTVSTHHVRVYWVDMLRITVTVDVSSSRVESRRPSPSFPPPLSVDLSTGSLCAPPSSALSLSSSSNKAASTSV